MCSLDNRKARAVRPKSVPIPTIRIPNRGPFHACSRQQKRKEKKTKSKTKPPKPSLTHT